MSLKSFQTTEYQFGFFRICQKGNFSNQYFRSSAHYNKKIYLVSPKKEQEKK